MKYFLANSLPETYLDTLPLLDYSLPNLPYKTLLFLALLALAYYLYKKYIKNKKLPETVLPKTTTQKKYDEKSEIIEKIKNIQLSYEPSKNKNAKLRDGLHELSTFLKTYMERKIGQEIEEMTVREMEQVLSEAETIKFFRLLESLQFGKDEPAYSHLKNSCDRAIVLVKSSKMVKAKQRSN